MSDYEEQSSNEKKDQEEKSYKSPSFHGGGDTYRNQARYVAGLGNTWASQNFEATRPYFC